MNAIPSRALPRHLAVVLTLAHVLEQPDRSPKAAPDQYRAVVQHLSDELAKVPADAALQAVLDAHPAAAEVYENLNYRHAGLCRSPLEWAMRAEMSAKEVIRRVAKA
jgi:hypothetical protein